MISVGWAAMVLLGLPAIASAQPPVAEEPAPATADPVPAVEEDTPLPVEQTPPAPAVPPAPPPVELTPYGLLVLNTWINTHRLQNSDIPDRVAPIPAGAEEGELSLGMTTRSSRFGLKIASPPVAAAIGAEAVTGTLELDFFGGNFSNNVTYTMSHPRMRLFFVKLDLGSVDLVLGQDWVLISPVNPTSLQHVALPAFQRSGNLWSRLPQIRVDVAAGPLLIQAGVLAPLSTDTIESADPFSAGRPRSSGSERSMLPSLQGRVAFSTEMGTEKLVVGAGGHVGMEEFATTMVDPMTMMMVPTGRTENALSWAGVLDFVVPVAGLLTIQGEAFYGQNLDGFFSRANVTPTTGDPQGALGGWLQVSVKVGQLTIAGAAGLEQLVLDPEPTGGAPNAVQLFGTVIWAPAPTFKLGAEVYHLRTDDGGMAEVRSGNQISLSAHFGF